jgi:microcystin degradation protein MlrC
MRVFVGGIATETNTFAATPTGMGGFAEMGIRRGDGSGELHPFAAFDRALGAWAARDGHVLVRGLMAFAMPSGITLRSVYEALRDEMLEGLRRALPVDAVILPLHGAMVAEGYPDCEGDQIRRVREIVGPEVPIGVELDLHCHFTEAMRTNADIVVAYKEYPHTDVGERLEEVWRLTLAAAERRIRPAIAVHDCRMIGFWHTTREPMKSFVQRMKALEGHDGVLSVSFGHGFPYGDVPEAGAKVWVVSDSDAANAAALAAELAAELGREIWALRELTGTQAVDVDTALDRLLAAPAGRPVVLADDADNAGGGASSDATFVLERLVARGIGNVALGAFWDLGAVQICRDAGAGATLELRIGGKCSPASGQPVDLRVTIRALKDDHTQTGFGGTPNACGPSVWVSTAEGLDIVLISRRQQVIGSDLFSGLGIDLAARRGIVVKSSQHFHAAFAPLAQQVIYVTSPGLLRQDFAAIPYRHRDLNVWPRVADPWRAGA